MRTVIARQLGDRRAERLGTFEYHPDVEHHQRLERDVADLTLRDAGLATWRVEVRIIAYGVVRFMKV